MSINSKWYLIWYLLYIFYSFSFCLKVLLMSLQFKSVKWPIKKGEHVNWQSCSKCSNRPRKLKFFFVTLQHSALGFRSEKLISWEREIVVHKLLSKKVFMLRSKSLLSDLGGAERERHFWVRDAHNQLIYSCHLGLTLKTSTGY